MKLSTLQKRLERSPGLEGYVIIERSGKLLASSLGERSAQFNRTEFISWALNCLHFLEERGSTQARAFFEYSDVHLHWFPLENFVVAALFSRASNPAAVDQQLISQLGIMAKQDKSSGKKKGETVFIKISESGSGSTQGPIKATKGGPSPAIIGGVAVLVLGLIGALIYFATAGGDGEPEGNETAEEATLPEETMLPEERAEFAKEQSDSLLQVARNYQAQEFATNDFAKGVSLKSTGERSYNAGNWDAAADELERAAVFLGTAALEAVKARLDAALAAQGLGNVENISPPGWSEFEQTLQQAEAMSENGNYVSALEAVEALKNRIPALRQSAADHLRGLAAEAVASGNNHMALNFYQDLVAIEPDNREAQRFIDLNIRQPGETEENSIGMTLAYIPPGEFMRGSPETEGGRDSDEVRHEVEISRGFWMSAYEVTQGQYERVMGVSVADQMEDPRPNYVGENLPAHSVTWEEAREFCRRLSEMEDATYRLPTEAEWEYAARAGRETAYLTGIRLSAQEANIFDPSRTSGFGRPLAVGTASEPNPWGLYDIHGNVWEWCLDWRADYPVAEAPLVDPQGPEDSEIPDINLASKIARGGSYQDEDQDARFANRFSNSPAVRVEYIGFRPIRELE